MFGQATHVQPSVEKPSTVSCWKTSKRRSQGSNCQPTWTTSSWADSSPHLLPTLLAVYLPRLPRSAPSVAEGSFHWRLWLPACWSSPEWWRLGKLAGDRNPLWTPALAEPNREPRSGVTSLSPALSAGEGMKYELLLISCLITVLTSTVIYLLMECFAI